MKSVLLGAVAVVLIGSAGCRDPIEPGATGIFRIDKLEAPATVAAGKPISVVLTVERGYCDRFDRFEIRRSAVGAIVTAWGRNSVYENQNCPDILLSERHTLVLDPPFGDSFIVVVNRLREDPLTARIEIQ